MTLQANKIWLAIVVTIILDAVIRGPNQSFGGWLFQDMTFWLHICTR